MKPQLVTAEGIEVDFWGNVRDPFVTMRDKYGVWPLTVWPVDLTDESVKMANELINDTETRDGALQAGAANTRFKKNKSTYQTSASRFNPMLATCILNCYGPDEGVVYDSFAGGGTRAIVAAKRGLHYVGVELRQQQVEHDLATAKRLGVEDLVTIHQGDSRFSPVGSNSADFHYTCPPYYNLERYKGGDGDLSMVDSYEAFLDGMETVVKETWRVLKPGALSAWVIGLHREPDSELLPLNHDLATLHRNNGFEFREEVILTPKQTPAMTRVGMFEKGKRHLVRIHEYLLVFKKV